MWRYLVGVVAGALVAVAGVLWWKAPVAAEQRGRPAAVTAQPAATADEPLPEPPVATERTREKRRFARYDKDKDGGVARDEYLLSRRKAFAKLDANGDGRLSFDEWAIKTTAKFAGADRDKSGVLTAAEFATTRVIRKAPRRVACPPPTARDEEAES